MLYSVVSTGIKQTADNLMTLYDNGNLSISRVTYGYMGKHSCIVQNDYVGTYVTHNLNIECKLLVISTCVEVDLMIKRNFMLRAQLLRPFWFTVGLMINFYFHLTISMHYQAIRRQ